MFKDFIRGIGSVLVLYPQERKTPVFKSFSSKNNFLPSARSSIEETIRGDWERIGQDMWNVISREVVK